MIAHTPPAAATTAPAETPGHHPINTDRPSSYVFDSYETGLGCYSWTAIFSTFEGELEKVWIETPQVLVDEDTTEVVDVTRQCELELLASISWDWWWRQ